VDPAPEAAAARIEQLTDQAIDEFVRDAMTALAEPFEGGRSRYTTSTVDEGWEGHGEQPPPSSKTASPFGDAETNLPHRPEPTIILSGSQAGHDGTNGSAFRAREVPILEGEDLRESLSGALPHENRSPELEEELDEQFLRDDLDDLDEGWRSDPLAESEPATRGPIARALREKMSAMARSLFPENRAPSTAGEEYSTDTLAKTHPLTRSRSAAAASGSGSGLATADVPSRGELDRADTDMAGLLARLFSGRFTGRVVLRRPPAEKIVFIEQGRPVFATSNLPHDRMGDLLYREGKITRAQYSRSRELVLESGRRMGEVLVELGFLKPRELLPAVRRHIEDIIYSLFAWDSGEFASIPGETSSERIRLSRHPAALVLEGVRRKYGIDMLEQRLGSAKAIISIRSTEELAAIVGVADLSERERALLEGFDGQRELREVATEAGVELLNAMQLAYGMCALGAAEVVGGLVNHHTQPHAGRGGALVAETDLTIDRERVRARAALVAEADYFLLLGVRRDASGFEIKRAYESARRDYSAESFPDEVRDELSREISLINELIDEAYHVLRDENIRRSYLANLRD
jgi:hypothetical protein